MKLLSVFILSAFIFSCNATEENQDDNNFDTQKIIIEAKGLTFTELPETVKAKASNSFVFKPVGYDPEEIEKEKGYYLRLTVDNSLLAQASTDRGTWKENDLLDSSNLGGLYGKYRNRPELFDGNNQLIAPTRKFEGYELIQVVRHNAIDTTYWGPFSGMPSKLVLNCSSLDSAANPVAVVLRQ